MKLAMKPEEIALFKSLLACSRRYVEFGAGGSTVLAASLVKEAVTSVDSSKEWLDRVRQDCEAQKCPVSPTLIHVDIGELKDWGYPRDTKRRPDWPRYYSWLGDSRDGALADLFLVDGRFRVASFLQVFLQGNPDSLIAIHDFANRPKYHVIHEFGREVARAENFSVFLRRPGADRKRALEVLEAHAYVAD
ncbi:hypothetical protein GXW71_14520 [Roseomonas hellenica]|uniref:Class I SAM-dependent methyltransferase n=1 Tax=Plastoroseomonas hellenica TaxID=2687306 RepID=A0ABS5EZ33_9PROT|nr:hypothetical protein [Plastoroseomonas hellenica]MBR0665570.1 hypothetical protein [Plastoroseomonas hellenica]